MTIARVYFIISQDQMATRETSGPIDIYYNVYELRKDLFTSFDFDGLYCIWEGASMDLLSALIHRSDSINVSNENNAYEEIYVVNTLIREVATTTGVQLKHLQMAIGMGLDQGITFLC